MKTKYSITLLLILTILLSSISTVRIQAVVADSSAKQLYKLGLLSNISESELEAPLNRIVGLTMLLKAIGYKNIDADKSVKSHAFIDFEGDYTWGSGWANIGVSMHITAGTSQTTYEPSKTMSKKEFVTGQLRILGYGLDESWNNCANLAIALGLIATESELVDYKFTKEEATEIMYRALGVNIKDSAELTLIEYLVRDGVVDETIAKEMKFPSLNPLWIKAVIPLTNQLIQLKLVNPIDVVPINEIQIVDSYGTELLVNSGEVGDDGYTAIIQTSYQKGYIKHTINTNNLTFSYIALPIDVTKPKLTGVVALSNTSIELTFDEWIHESAKQTKNFTVEGLVINKVEFAKDADGKSIYNKIILTTNAQQSAKGYIARVANVTDWSNNTIDSSFNSRSFTGLALDVGAPKINSVIALNSTTVQITFSENVEEIEAEKLQNYTIQGLVITKAERQDIYNVVRLTTSDHINGYVYKVETGFIKDLFGNIIDPNYSKATFYGTGVGSSQLKLITAFATSNTTIKVIFSQPVTDETGFMEYAYYLGEELGYPASVIKDTAITSGTVWILTTKEQLNQEYTLDVTGVKDYIGNVLDEATDTAVFTGIPAND